jgi:hypothetical protein
MLTAVPDLVDRIRRELDDRIAALRPVAEEFGRLERAADALDRASGGGDAAAPSASAARPARSGGGAKRTGRRRTTRSTTGRAAPGQTQLRVIEQLRSNPGSSSTAVAQALGISANAAAATISRLVKQGRVHRGDTGGYSADVPASPAPDAPGA